MTITEYANEVDVSVKLVIDKAQEFGFQVFDEDDLLEQEAIYMLDDYFSNTQKEPKAIELNAEEVKILDNLDEEAQEDINSIFFKAIKEEYKGIIAYLTNKYGKYYFSHITDKNGMSPLLTSAVNGNLEIFKLLIEHGLSYKEKGYNNVTPIYEASKNGHLEVVNYLISLGAKVNVQAVNWEMPLHTAVRNNHHSIVKTLLQHGAMVNAKIYGEFITPLHIASKYGDLEMVKILIDNDAYLHDKNKYGVKALSFASIHGHLDVVKYLIDKGIHHEDEDNDGWTPIFYASDGGHLDVVKYLVEIGADYKKVSKDHTDPISLSKRNTDVFNYLME